ncbi:MAG: PTS system permease (IIAMan), nitrogen regulatory IIA protein, partial [uncultured Sphingosinicella sp.]
DWFGAGDPRTAGVGIRHRDGACGRAAGADRGDLHRARRRHGGEAQRHRRGHRESERRQGRDHPHRPVRRHPVKPRHILDAQPGDRGDCRRQPADAYPAGRRAQDAGREVRGRSRAGGGAEIYLGGFRDPGGGRL